MQYPQSVTTHNQPYNYEHRALIVAGDAGLRATSRNTLQHARWHVDACHSFNQFQALPRQDGWPLVVVADDRAGLPEQMLHYLQADIVRERSYVIVLTQAPSVTQAIQYLQLRAFEYLPLPLDPVRLLALSTQVQRLAQYKSTAPIAEQRVLAEPSEPALIGQSAALLELTKQLVRLAPAHNLRLFLTGETGTGKEVIARKIHELSGCTGPFLAVNCAATVESLLESELFGHEKGAFTGALSAKPGLWEAAENGTLFLDEITEAAPSVQAKLLRTLQENVIRRVGSNREIKVNARVIAASNRILETAVAEKTFREDLFYRLGQVLRIPPLRERLEDIPLLAQHFCQRAVPHCIIAPEAMNLLCSWPWPGNVRELESVMLKLANLSGSVILPEHVLEHIQPSRVLPPWMSLPFLSALPCMTEERFPNLHDLRNWYAAVLDFYGCSQAEIARRLGLDPRTVAKALQEAHAQFPVPKRT
jgi:DNA-binding NtrC family response regulator